MEKKEKVSLKINLSKKCYKRLIAQLEAIKALNIKNKPLNVEELIEFNLESLLNDERIAEAQKRIQDLIDLIKDKGFDVSDLFGANAMDDETEEDIYKQELKVKNAHKKKS